MSTNKTPARKLTRAERKQIDAAIARAKRQDKRKKSAQDSIPFQRMYPDGVCRVTDSYYTKTVQFQDINYQLNQNEDKTAIFDGWCDFLNYFDSSIRFQLSFINLSATRDTYARRIAIPLQGDCFDKLRTEYTGMLQSQLARGNNGLIKTKYLTFGVEADGLKAAKPRLDRIETDILNNFRRLGVQAEALNGMERLRLLHGMLHMDEPQPFRFSWDWLAPSGLSVKDFIAPSAFEFKTGSCFGVGSKTGCVSFLQILAPELNDRMAFLKSGKGFYCTYGRTDRNSACPTEAIHLAADIEQRIYDAIMLFLKAADEKGNLSDKFLKKKKSEIQKNMDMLTDFQKQCGKLKKQKLKSYEEYSGGVMTKQAYLDDKRIIDEKLRTIEISIATAKQRIADLESLEESEPQTSQFDRFLNELRLTYEMANAFVEAVYIYPDGTNEICWKFKDFTEGNLTGINQM